ncbi:MAG: M48 family metallopeptidase [Candidatus Sumerlaeota bacterium]|nr:M48 family metallopeptidase [Candidatus Sumerlaeota bacterium]
MYDLIAANKRNSWVLIILMSALVVALGVAIGAAAAQSAYGGLVIALGVAVVMFLVSWYGGGGLIMMVSGAHKIAHGDNPRLDNVVEEMAIAAGIPKPEIYIIDDTAPNAFATGRDPNHAAVAITTGLLEKLDRDELQGVMAHEMSHVRNFDIRYAMLMAVMVGTIALLADFFLRMTFYGRGARRRSSEGRGGGGAQAILFLIAIVLAILAPIVGKIIQLAMSRQREFLADASAAELTRYPEGLARALEKIAKDPEPLEAANRATQHLYIVNPVKSLKGEEGFISHLFSTHPATAERIARLRAIAPAAPQA